MELFEVATKLEHIELVAKIAHMEDCTNRDRHVALHLISDLAKEMKAGVKNVQKPHGGGCSEGAGL